MSRRNPYATALRHHRQQIVPDKRRELLKRERAPQGPDCECEDPDCDA